MARNVEIKARVRDARGLQRRAAELADRGPEVIDQDDTFFRCADGRLKLRELSTEHGQLVHYHRADESGPRLSRYTIVDTAHPAALRATLLAALGGAGRVRKRRRLYMIGRTRIHLDRVEDLGDFMEIEVVLEEGESEDSGLAEAHALMRRLGVDAGDLIARAYVDLLPAVTK